MRTLSDFPLLTAFAAELKARRATLGVSQDSIAHAAGMNRTFVAKLELGQTTLSLTSLYKLSEALGVEPAELVASVSRRLEE